jgi:hypothetical protein
MESFKFFNYVEHYRIIQKRADLIEFLVKLRGDFVNKVVGEELVSHFRKVLNVTAEDLAFETRFVNEIPMDKSGKLTSVVSEIPSSS